jgi:excisionase family DNA binding protein
MENDEAKYELVSGGLDQVPEAARFLGVSRSQVYKLMDQGCLPYVKIGKSRRIPHRAVVELAAKNLVMRA